MYKLRDEARSQAAARLSRITDSESSDKTAGDGVSEDYGVKAAGPSSSAKFKRGGAVEGKASKPRLDRAPRKSSVKKSVGGAIANSDLNLMGNSGAGGASALTVGSSSPAKESSSASIKEEPARPAGGENGGEGSSGSYSKGGAAKRAMGGYVSPQYKKGGRVEGSKADMKEDRALAKKAGMTLADWEKSDADKKHDAPIKRATGGAVKASKGRTNVNIIIAPQGGAAAEPAMPVPAPAMMKMPVGPVPAPMVAAPPADGPFPNAQPAIPPAALAALAGAGPKPEMPMPMRKHGGRVHTEAGAGSGEGRLAKIKAYDLHGC